MLKNKKRDWKKILAALVLFSFIAPIGFLIYKISTTTNDVIPNSGEVRVRSDYVLMLLQCVLGIIAMAIPSVLQKKFKLEIPTAMYYFYVLFLYAAIFLGEVRNFYYRFQYWDLILHTLSGTMIGFLGFSVVDILNKENDKVSLDPFFVAFFSFCFAMTLGGIWEIYEFVSDGLLGTNMQKFALESGIVLQGRDALSDTMEDIIVDGIGALVASTLGYISIKYKFTFLNWFKIKSNKKQETNEKKITGGTDETAHLK
jgi:uncharacterized membrane protein YjdF